jgi:hypothetical protein
MLAVSNAPRFVSRVLSDVNGRQFRLTFLVAFVNGELKGRLVSAEPLFVSSAERQQGVRALLEGEVTDGSFCLPAICNEKKPETTFIPDFAPIVSPYIELYFFTSQPTRAPSFVPARELQYGENGKVS